MSSVRVYTSPASLDPRELIGGLVIVIDLLRASTTIVHALAAGAAAVAPCESVERARALVATLAPGSFLLGGERHGIRIEGFDLGNSPTEYTSERVRARTIVFTTTNGTIALHRAAPAGRIMIGCFANLSAIVGAANESGLPIHLLCAGIHGEPCREDAICAGAIASRLIGGGCRTVGDETDFACALWKSIPPGHASLSAALLESEGGQNLLSAHLEADIPICAAIDSSDVVPIWDPVARVLR